MRIGYLDCFAGISGDMLLGALVDAGVPRAVLEDATAALDLGASLRFETVSRSGISATKVHVLEGEHLAEDAHTPGNRGEQAAGQAHAAEHVPEPEPASAEPPQSQAQSQATPPRPFSPFDLKAEASEAPSASPLPAAAVETAQHHHAHEHAAHTHEHTHAHTADGPQDGPHGHAHRHAHTHGRSLTVIRRLIAESQLADPVKQLATRAFELLGASEASVHNVPVDDIHFHEVGAVDAIVDIVAAAAGLLHLGVEAWFCSALNVGGGFVDCAHGHFPVPAPATADLLRELPTYSAGVSMELVTPTGAALIRALAPTAGAQPAMRVATIGYGAGTRDPKGFPNVVRLMVGESMPGGAVASSVQQGQQTQQPGGTARTSFTPAAPLAGTTTGSQPGNNMPAEPRAEQVAVLETALDDLSPQLIAYVTEKALAAGALDVMLTAVIMKKGRPGTLLTVLARPEDGGELEHLLLRETSTLGVRARLEWRSCLDREHRTVETPYGDVRVKVGRLGNEILNATPEFEDSRALAEQRNVPLKRVQAAATAAFAALDGQSTDSSDA